MFGKILVALDQEETCISLFQQAVTLAQTMDADLMLLHVLSPESDENITLPGYTGLVYHPLGADASIWDVYRERYQACEARGLELLNSFTDQALSAGVNTEFTQIPGSPGRAICDLAQTWEADLVMVGSHGRKGLGEMLLGSVSNYVMHHATCSVLVVHNLEQPKTGTDLSNLAAVEG